MREPRDTAFRRTVSKVEQAMRRAAADALDEGIAELAVTTVGNVYPGGAELGEAPAVVLTPTRVGAAPVVVEIYGDELWTLGADGGPPFEFYSGMHGDPLRVLHDLVRAVLAGSYSTECRRRDRSRFLGIFPARAAWEEVATFDTPAGPIVSSRVGAAPCEEGVRTYHPYAPATEAA